MGNLYYKGATATCLALCKLCDEFHIARSNCISRKSFLFLSHKGLLNVLCSGLAQTGASGNAVSWTEKALFLWRWCECRVGAYTWAAVLRAVPVKNAEALRLLSQTISKLFTLICSTRRWGCWGLEAALISLVLVTASGHRAPKPYRQDKGVERGYSHWALGSLTRDWTSPIHSRTEKRLIR